MIINKFGIISSIFLLKFSPTPTTNDESVDDFSPCPAMLSELTCPGMDRRVASYADMRGECNLYGHRGEEVIYLRSFAEKGETDGRRAGHTSNSNSLLEYKILTNIMTTF